MDRESVIILGGGIAGLSAAQELAERGFSVSIYEANSTIGGKARSQYLPGTGKAGRRDLPGEHGFRFFPAFYRHVIDTMSRIPDPETGGSVRDNLRPATRVAVGFVDGSPTLELLRRRPERIRELYEVFLGDPNRLGIRAQDALHLSERVLRYFTSCDRRRLEVYEHQSFWDYFQGDRLSARAQLLLASLPRTLVAMDARRGSARTLGDILMQLILDCGRDGRDADRLLCGPTSERWLVPWRRYLESLGVQFYLDHKVQALSCTSDVINGVSFANGQVARADQYVVALPIEVLRGLLHPTLAKADPGLSRLSSLSPGRFSAMLGWMSGLQFYLRRDVPIVRGHAFYPDSPWALTSISQPQFWGGGLAERYGDGQVAGLISVDISDFSTPGTLVRKPACECTPEEIAKEVFHQLKSALRNRQGALLRDDDLLHFHLDEELIPKREGPGLKNQAPLLLHPPGSWYDRPRAETALSNLTLAGDYVQTTTNLATMEGANEAARRAVNGILLRSRRAHTPCTLWPLREPAIFGPLKRLDERAFEIEAPWRGGPSVSCSVPRPDAAGFGCNRPSC